MLIEPVKVGRFGRLRNELLRRVTVQVSYRYKEAPPARDMPRRAVDLVRESLRWVVQQMM